MTTLDAPRLSIVVPVLDDAAALDGLLEELSAAPRHDVEVLVVDGGSQDDPAGPAARHGARLLCSAPGRGRQLAAGADAARGLWIWFLHADSGDVRGPLDYLLTLAAAEPGVGSGPLWGRFDPAFDEATPALRLVAFMMRQRSRVTGICTGDQGIFVRRDVLAAAGGVPVQPLMEDIELSRRLKSLARPVCRSETLTTSSRRWQRSGVARTVMSMWWLRLRYWLGADPVQLAREYYR